MSHPTFAKVVSRDLQNTQFPARVYVDLNMTNSNYEKPAVPIEFNEARAEPIIKDAEAYNVAVARFHIDTLTLPVWIPLLQQGEVNNTIYSFTLTYKSHAFQAYLTFVPQDSTLPTPAAGNNSDPYYHVYNFSYVKDLLNTTLLAAFNGLKALVEADSDTLPTSFEPWFLYDPSSSELILNADKSAYDHALANPIVVFMNDAMHKMVSSFPVYRFTNNITNGKNYQLIIKNNHSQNVMQITDDLQVLLSYMEQSCTGMWSPIDSILFSSGNLPVRGSLVPSPATFGTSNSTNSFSSSTVSLLTDFQISQVTGKESRGSVEYAPSFYRKIDLLGHGSIDTINIRVFWRDIYGAVHDLKLPAGCNASIKLLFIRRDLEI